MAHMVHVTSKEGQATDVEGAQFNIQHECSYLVT